MIKKITQNEISTLGISALPTRPNAPEISGGAGYSADDMKKAFDALPLLIITRYNQLVDGISSRGIGSLASMIPTDIYENHSLDDMINDLYDGRFASYLMVSGRSLATEIAEIHEEIEKIKERLGI